MESTTSLNDNLVKIDNLLTALNYIFEEIETRKQDCVNEEKIEHTLISIADSYMSSGKMVRQVTKRIADDYWWSIIREVETNIRSTITSIVEQRIESTVRNELQNLGYTQQNTNQ